MRRAILLLSCSLMALAATPSRASQTFLQMSSQRGDYVGAGQEYSYTLADGTFSATANQFQPSGTNPVDVVSISFHTPGFTHFWGLDFSTTELGQGLTPGVYTGAVRFPFEDLVPGVQPGLDVSGDGRGSNTLTGSFTILQAVFDYSTPTPTVVSFEATFIQHSEGATPALTGTIAYNANAVPEPGTLALLALGGLGGIVTFRRRRRAS